jgi:uncharacterized protein YjbI with pentapeptide repeats
MTPSDGQRPDESVRPTWRPIPAWQWTLAAAAAVVIVAFVVTIWLLAIANGAKSGTDLANARLDAVRTGLAAGAGAGAAVGLMLAFRRQHHQEIATVLTDLDATERRITELYTKAVEQLGSDKAPVRLGGLYALERLAQDNPAHRQTIVNVICAYLRMPFSPAAPIGESNLEATDGPEAPAVDAATNAVAVGTGWQQERQVRFTAQRILAEHLRNDRVKDQHCTDPPSPRVWDDIRLHLAGATLIDFSLGDGVMADADFSGATFCGNATFTGIIFHGEVSFGEATFRGGARFGGATFNGVATFEEAAFSGDAGFTGATFSLPAVFREATFSDGATFDGASFNASADFTHATCSGPSEFEKATFDGQAKFYLAAFSGTAIFGDVTFGADADFHAAKFGGGAGFGGATFGADARFDEVTFSSDAAFAGVTFTSRAGFGHTRFNGPVRFYGAIFGGNAWFGGATFSDGEGRLSFDHSRVLSPGGGHVWPTGWCLGPDGNGAYTVVRANDADRS